MLYLVRQEVEYLVETDETDSDAIIKAIKQQKLTSNDENVKSVKILSTDLEYKSDKKFASITTNVSKGARSIIERAIRLEDLSDEVNGKITLGIKEYGIEPTEEVIEKFEVQSLPLGELPKGVEVAKLQKEIEVPEGLLDFEVTPSCKFSYADCINDPEVTKTIFKNTSTPLGGQNECMRCINGDKYESTAIQSS